MGRYTYFENGKWRIKVGDTEFAGPWVDKLSYYEELAPNLENTKDEAYNLGYQTCLHAKGLTWSEARELQAYRATGLTVERAAELGKADREGRVVMLPVGLGDTVYVADPDECSWVPTNNKIIPPLDRSITILYAPNQFRVVVIYSIIPAAVVTSK